MPPQKEKRRSGDIGRGNDLEKLAQKIKKNVGDIPPRWVPGIVAALVAIFAWSAWEPPPPPVLLVEGPVEGDATLYTGYYKLDTKRRVHGSPAWRHATRPDLFLSRDSVGAWKGGTEQGLERDLGFLRLRDRAAVFPSSRSIVDWEWHSGQDGAWVHEPALTCDEAELPQAPTVLLLEGGALTGAAAKYLGYYELQPEREVNGSPAWRHSEHNDLWIARAPNGNWSAPPPAAHAAPALPAARPPLYGRTEPPVPALPRAVGQPQRELGDPSGHIQLQDRSCLHPCSSSVVHWEWGDGKRWHTEPELKVYFR